MRTNDLKKLVQTKLKTLDNKVGVYHEIADDTAVFPHIVFSFRRIDLSDLSRQDYVLQVDVWDRSNSTQKVDDLADGVENLLQAQNLPQKNVLPTFYLIDRKMVEDEDKMIRHRQIQFQVQNYERS